MNQGTIERFYERFARVYDLIFDKIMHPGRVAAIETMGLSRGDRILEVGVGTGLNLPLYPPGVFVTGVDLSRPMLEKARRRGERTKDLGVDLRVMDAQYLEFPDESFDHVYAPYVVSVVSDPEAALLEMKRVCREGGSVVIVNHFRSRNAVGSWLEKTLSPMANHMGFRLDLPVDEILGDPGLFLEKNRRVNLFGIWRLIVLRKPRRGEKIRRDTAVPVPLDLVSPESSASA